MAIAAAVKLSEARVLESGVQAAWYPSVVDLTPIVSFLTGALTTAFASWIQHHYATKTQRLEREAQARIKRECRRRVGSVEI